MEICPHPDPAVYLFNYFQFSSVQFSSAERAAAGPAPLSALGAPAPRGGAGASLRRVSLFRPFRSCFGTTGPAPAGRHTLNQRTRHALMQTCTGSKGLVCEYLLYRPHLARETNKQLTPTQANGEP